MIASSLVSYILGVLSVIVACRVYKVCNQRILKSSNARNPIQGSLASVVYDEVKKENVQVEKNVAYGQIAR